MIWGNFVYKSFSFAWCDKDFSFLLIEMTTEFNQEMYAHIKAKKNESLSSLGQRRVRVI